MNRLEQISAFMDGEADQPAETIMAGISNDPALRGAWQRYHLIGDAMRGQLPGHLTGPELAASIAAAVDREPAILSPASRRKSPVQRALKPAAGLAIAASVAMVAIIGLRGLNEATSTTGSPTVAATDSASTEDNPVQSLQPASQAPLARTVSTDSQPLQPSAQEQSGGQYGFSSYLINHNEYRANSGVRGIMPYARIVAPNDNEQ